MSDNSNSEEIFHKKTNKTGVTTRMGRAREEKGQKGDTERKVGSDNEGNDCRDQVEERNGYGVVSIERAFVGQVVVLGQEGDVVIGKQAMGKLTQIFGKEVDERVVFHKLKTDTDRDMWKYSRERAQEKMKEKQVEMWGNERDIWTLEQVEGEIRRREESTMTKAVESMKIAETNKETAMETDDSGEARGEGGAGENDRNMKDSVITCESVNRSDGVETGCGVNKGEEQRMEGGQGDERREGEMKSTQVHEETEGRQELTEDEVCGICGNRHENDDWNMECSMCWRWVYGGCLGFDSEEDLVEARKRYWTCLKCAQNARSGEEVRMGVKLGNELISTLRDEVREIKEDISSVAGDMKIVWTQEEVKDTMVKAVRECEAELVKKMNSMKIETQRMIKEEMRKVESNIEERREIDIETVKDRNRKMEIEAEKKRSRIETLELENRSLMESKWKMQLTISERDEEIRKLKERNERIGNGEKGLRNKFEKELEELQKTVDQKEKDIMMYKEYKEKYEKLDEWAEEAASDTHKMQLYIKDLKNDMEVKEKLIQRLRAEGEREKKARIDATNEVGEMKAQLEKQRRSVEDEAERRKEKGGKGIISWGSRMDLRDRERERRERSQERDMSRDRDRSLERNRGWGVQEENRGQTEWGREGRERDRRNRRGSSHEEERHRGGWDKTGSDGWAREGNERSRVRSRMSELDDIRKGNAMKRGRSPSESEVNRKRSYKKGLFIISDSQMRDLVSEESMIAGMHNSGLEKSIRLLRGRKTDQIKEWLKQEGRNVIKEETVMVVAGSNDLLKRGDMSEDTVMRNIEDNMEDIAGMMEQDGKKCILVGPPYMKGIPKDVVEKVDRIFERVARKHDWRSLNMNRVMRIVDGVDSDGPSKNTEEMIRRYTGEAGIHVKKCISLEVMEEACRRAGIDWNYDEKVEWRGKDMMDKRYGKGVCWACGDRHPRDHEKKCCKDITCEFCKRKGHTERMCHDKHSMCFHCGEYGHGTTRCSWSRH